MTARVWLLLSGLCALGVAINFRAGAGLPSALSWALAPLFGACGVMALVLAATGWRWLAWPTGTVMLGAIGTRLIAATAHAWTARTVWDPATRLTWAVWLWVAFGVAIIHSRIVTPWVVMRRL